MQAVPAAAGDGIVKRKLQIVVAQEPVESRPGFAAPAAVASYAVRLQTRGDRAGGFNRLLIEAGFFSTLAIETLRPDGHKVAVDFAALCLHTAKSSDSRPAEIMRSSEQAEPTSSMACGNLALP